MAPRQQLSSTLLCTARFSNVLEAFGHVTHCKNVIKFNKIIQLRGKRVIIDFKRIQSHLQTFKCVKQVLA